jgi:hypothetical protein
MVIVVVAEIQEARGGYSRFGLRRADLSAKTKSASEFT